MRSRFLRSTRHAARTISPGTFADCETLEPRIVLSAFTGTAPLPDIGSLEDPGNPIVRLVTTFGDIDLEMFPLTSPRTVQNFLFYVDTGRYDETFSHRFVEDFVFQFGGFGFRDDGNTSPGFFEVPTEPPIQNEFNRSNTERTLSFAKLGGDPDSADSQWFINLGDNSANLDNQNGGFSVFGRVLDDRSWDVVQSLTTFATVDLTSAAPPFSSAFTDVPVAPGFDRGDPQEAFFLYVIDAEIIRPSAGQFFDQRLVYPDGFRGLTDTRVVISNPNTVNADFQIIVRYEADAREEVIGAGTINPHGNFTLTYQNGLDLIRQGVPYSLEIQSYLNGGGFNPQPISAEFLHADNFLARNSTIAESFFNPERIGALRAWGFGGVPAAEPSANADLVQARRPFIVWQNLEAADGTVFVTLYRTDADPIVESFDLDAKRRGGMSVASIFTGADLQGYVGARVTSTVDIVAAMSYYENIIDSSIPVGQGALQNAAAFGTLLAPQLNSPRGALADVRPSRVATPSHITFVNPSSEVATVTLSLVRNDGSFVSRQIAIGAERGTAFALDAAALGFEPGESLTAYYAATFPVFAHYAGIDDLPNGRYKRTGAAFNTAATSNALFAAGALANERLIVFNPATAPGASVNFQVQFHFADETFGAGDLFTVAPFQRLEIDLAALAAEQGNDSTFGVAIVSERRVGGQLVPSPLIVSRYRADNGVEVVQSSPTLAGSLLSLNDRSILA
ncbi:MAG: peptidylprolyl isomerase [Planctomycetota bacterium]